MLKRDNFTQIFEQKGGEERWKNTTVTHEEQEENGYVTTKRMKCRKSRVDIFALFFCSVQKLHTHI